eukprot:GHVH01008346.1.p1 GENE.GHVH01008346.1~~GHVH01008346.1.p1  ORF type:complete len:878 (-),score=114.42 GHVH01008346.1:51-2402(-)
MVGYKDPSLITIHENGVMIVWDLSLGMPRQRFTFNTLRFTGLVSSKSSTTDEDGDVDTSQLFFVSTESGTLKCFEYDMVDRQMSEKRHRVQKASAGISSMAVLSSNLLALGSMDGNIILADTSRGEVDSICVAANLSITHLVAMEDIYGDGQWHLMCGDSMGGLNSIRIMEQSMTFEQQLSVSNPEDKSGLRGPCAGLLFNSSMNLLVACSQDGSARVFKTPASQEVACGATRWTIVDSAIYPVAGASIMGLAGHTSTQGELDLYVLGNNETVMKMRLLDDGIDRDHKHRKKVHMLSGLQAPVDGCVALNRSDRIVFAADSDGLSIYNFPVVRPRADDVEESPPSNQNVRFVSQDVAAVLMVDLDAAAIIPEALGRAEFSSREVPSTTVTTYSATTPNSTFHSVESVDCTADGVNVAVVSRHGGLRMLSCSFDSDAPQNSKKRLMDITFDQLSDQLSKCSIFDARFLLNKEFDSHPLLVASILFPNLHGVNVEVPSGGVHMASMSFGIAVIERLNYGIWGISAFKQTSSPLSHLNLLTNASSNRYVEISVCGLSLTKGWAGSTGLPTPEFEIVKFKLSRGREALSAFGSKISEAKSADGACSLLDLIALQWVDRKTLYGVDKMGLPRIVNLSDKSYSIGPKCEGGNIFAFSRAQVVVSPAGRHIVTIQYNGRVWVAKWTDGGAVEYEPVSGKGQSVSDLFVVTDTAWLEALHCKKSMLSPGSSTVKDQKINVIGFGPRPVSLDKPIEVRSDEAKLRAGVTLSMEDFFKHGKKRPGDRTKFGKH